MAQKDEQLKFRETSSDGSAMASHKKKQNVTKRTPMHISMKYRRRLPRKRGFPILQRLDGEWITDSEIKDVETECGHAIEYFKPPVQLKSEARSASIPAARVIQRVQIDAENGHEVSLESGEGEEEEDDSDHAHELRAASSQSDSSTRRIGGTQSTLAHTSAAKSRTFGGTSGGGNGVSGDLDDTSEEQSIIHHLFQPSASALEDSTTTATASQPTDSRCQRANLATKSTTTAANNDDDDGDEKELEPWNYPVSTFDTLNSEERQYVRYKSKQVGSTIERDDHFFDSSVFLDCVALAERSRRLTQNSTALWLALDSKQQKRMLQTLIDADEKVIEEERIAQEQTVHKYRLHLINARSYTPHNNRQIEELVRKVNNTSESPWQRRNWKAIEVQQQQSPSSFPKKANSNKPRPSSSASAITSEMGGGVDFATPEVSCRFRSIETVEKAAQDALPDVNSHNLLVRCSEIRQHADKHMKALHLHCGRFLEDEAEWECMRQDPTNLVRRHLKRRLYQHAQEVEIGSTHFFYSSLFN